MAPSVITQSRSSLGAGLYGMVITTGTSPNPPSTKRTGPIDLGYAWRMGWSQLRFWPSAVLGSRRHPSCREAATTFHGGPGLVTGRMPRWQLPFRAWRTIVSGPTTARSACVLT